MQPRVSTRRRLALLVALAHLGTVAHAALHVHTQAADGTWFERAAESPELSKTAATEGHSQLGGPVEFSRWEPGPPCLAMVASEMTYLMHAPSVTPPTTALHTVHLVPRPDAAAPPLTPLTLAPKASPPRAA